MSDNPFAEFERLTFQSDRAWKCHEARGRIMIAPGNNCSKMGGMINWRNAEWVIYSDEEPEFEEVVWSTGIAVPGGDGLK